MSVVTLDTCALIWWQYEPDKLTSKALETIESADQVDLPDVILWEFALLVSLGKLDRARSIDPLLAVLENGQHDGRLRRSRISDRALAEFANLSIPQLPPDLKVGGRANKKKHSDPFDRLIIAHVRTSKLPVVTSDAAFDLYDGVERVW